jgi:hypothetical protein
VCYFLSIASPLTLSEVRSMLPAGVTADLASLREQQSTKSLHPDAQTTAFLLIGRCSCDFVRQRLSDPREDERHLRDRYRRSGTPRPLIIAALERHRRGGAVRPPPGGWASSLATFIAEHARNAGPTLYLLLFSAEGHPSALSMPDNVARVPLARVLASPDGWLREGIPTLIVR